MEIPNHEIQGMSDEAHELSMLLEDAEAEWESILAELQKTRELFAQMPQILNELKDTDKENLKKCLVDFQNCCEQFRDVFEKLNGIDEIKKLWDSLEAQNQE